MQKTYDTLSTLGTGPEQLNNIDWCNKCAKFYGKVKALSGRLGLTVSGCMQEKRVELTCKRAGHVFSIPYHKKYECISCLKCKAETKVQEKERLRQEEELLHEKMRLE